MSRAVDSGREPVRPAGGTSPRKVVTGAAASVTFVAALLSSVAAAADRGPYIGIGAGASRLDPESRTPALTTIDRDGTGFHAFAGFDLARWLSAEGYVADLGSAGIGFLGRDVGDVDYLVYGVRALGTVWSARGGLLNKAGGARLGPSVYLATGVGGLDTDSSLEVRTDHPAHISFGAGVEMGFSRGVALRAELTGFDTDARYASVSLLKRFGTRDAPAPKRIAPEPVAVAPPAPAPEPPIKTFFRPVVPPYLYFSFDEDTLNAASKAKLDTFAEEVGPSGLDVEIDGHTDSVGPDAYNVELSIRRALAVRDHLVEAGIEPGRLSVVGAGKTRPLESNATEAGRALNRRADFSLR